MKKSFKAIKEISKVQTILNQYDLGHIELKVEVHHNSSDQKVPHLVAYTPNDLIVEVENNKLSFHEGESCKFEELNNYFSAELFAMHFTQRADYIHASVDQKVHCYNNNIHPAEYRATATTKRWKRGDAKDYSAKIQYWADKANTATTIKEKAIAQTRLHHFTEIQQTLKNKQS